MGLTVEAIGLSIEIEKCEDCPFYQEWEKPAGEWVATEGICTHPDLEQPVEKETIPEHCPLIFDLKNGFLKGKVKT